MAGKPFETSSGDLLADRRADYAEMLFASEDHAAAAELMLGALEIAPDWAMGWFRLGEFQEAAGALKQATEAWRMAQRLDPADHAGAALKLALAGATPGPEAPPSAFVETLFDQYAGKFDHALVETLDYRVPELLFDAIRAADQRRFAHAVDLGCGTGLMGERLRPVVDRLDGYDISAEMLRKACEKNVYDRLEKADLQTLEAPGEKADLITAADVFMYLGALDRIVAVIAESVAPAGLFAFSVEKLAVEGDYALQLSRRYAHGPAYIHRLLSENGFSLRSFTEATIRQDRGEPVTGLIVVAEKR
ncbi:methyltransferase domain-containing protein [Corticibacterium sp. UT-5YL-CI-8]|nr:methyltransferase domain-containing protein [Tianweitania sp. UT-5YL-CI-8]